MIDDSRQYLGELTAIQFRRFPIALNISPLLRYELLDELSNEQIVERWGNLDVLGFLTQVGAIPEPAPA